MIRKRNDAFVPNEEIRQELAKAVRRKKWNELLHFWQESEICCRQLWMMETDAVAEQMERIHTEYASAIQYNDENSLSGAVTLGYLSAMEYYYKPVRELPCRKRLCRFCLFT